MLQVLFLFCHILLSTWNLTVTRNGDIFAMSTVVNAPLVVYTISDVFFWSIALNVIQQYWKCSVVIVAVDVTNFHSDIAININFKCCPLAEASVALRRTERLMAKQCDEVSFGSFVKISPIPISPEFRNSAQEKLFCTQYTHKSWRKCHRNP